MAEPTYREVFEYIIAGLKNGEWPVATYFAVFLSFVLLRVGLSRLYHWNRRKQQLATVTCIFTRWADGLGKPFGTLSTAEQLESIAKLRTSLTGNPEIVIDFLVSLRVVAETLDPHQSVLAAFDHLAEEWQEKLPSSSIKRRRRLHGIDAQSASVLKQQPDL